SQQCSRWPNWILALGGLELDILLFIHDVSNGCIRSSHGHINSSPPPTHFSIKLSTRSPLRLYRFSFFSSAPLSSCLLVLDEASSNSWKNKNALVTYPTVSCRGVIGMTPARLVRPTVGLIPTTEFHDAGQIIDPSVSVPSVTAAMFAAAATAEPLLDQHGVAVTTYGVSPPRALQPFVKGRKLDHSAGLDLPRMTAPAARRRAATPASQRTTEPSSASDPAVVLSRSRVAMLSLRRTGTPCSGPKPRRPEARSASARAAWASASGLTSMTACSSGLRRATRSR
ncbi:hypothetical protein EE612_022344, partial [Oryza sativa]